MTQRRPPSSAAPRPADQGRAAAKARAPAAEAQVRRQLRRLADPPDEIGAPTEDGLQVIPPHEAPGAAVRSEPEDSGALLRQTRGESSAAVRSRVVAARMRQQHRWACLGFRPINAAAPLLVCLPLLTSKARRRLESSLRQMRRSARGVQHLLRVGCTVADLDCSNRIADHHIQEAFLLCSGDTAAGPSDPNLVRRLRTSQDKARALPNASLSPRHSAHP